ncbi:MAG: hypothetical protein AAFQ43_01820 [Bacteroidota bacterium]
MSRAALRQRLHPSIPLHPASLQHNTAPATASPGRGSRSPEASGGVAL